MNDIESINADILEMVNIRRKKGNRTNLKIEVEILHELFLVCDPAWVCLIYDKFEIEIMVRNHQQTPAFIIAYERLKFLNPVAFSDRYVALLYSTRGRWSNNE